MIYATFYLCKNNLVDSTVYIYERVVLHIHQFYIHEKGEEKIL